MMILFYKINYSWVGPFNNQRPPKKLIISSQTCLLIKNQFEHFMLLHVSVFFYIIPRLLEVAKIRITNFLYELIIHEIKLESNSFMYSFKDIMLAGTC